MGDHQLWVIIPDCKSVSGGCTNLEEFLKRSHDKLKQVMPGGSGVPASFSSSATFRALATGTCSKSKPAPRARGRARLSRSHDPALAKARKQQKDGRSEYRQVVALNPVEQLKADAVELISPW
jgi:hypothetical protein